ncbi:MAG: hypothetical protein OXJ52_08700 [Oligoflexia bacterium]|nr:hypothetical protein [Oligoflexia bacterium]
MFKVCKGAFIFIFFAYVPLGMAKIHIEPYVGYSFTSIGTTNLSRGLLEKGDIDKKTQQVIAEFSKRQLYQGISPGMRLGYSSIGLAVGVDLTWGYWKSLFAENWTSFRDRQTIISLLPGLFVSYKLPLLFRAYASLIPQASVQLKTKEGDKSCKRSRGGKIGISYLSLPFLSVNFEYLPLYIGGSGCQFWSHTGTVSANFTF